MDEQYLYSVSYKDWNSDLSGLIDRQMLAAGTSEEDAINNAKRQARSDSRDFNAIRIDAVMGMDISVVQPEARAADIGIEREATSSVPGPPIQAYIENAYAANIGGFTIPLPTTKEELQPWMDAIGAGTFRETDIAIREVRSSVPGLEDILHNLLADIISLDELNYLAAKIGDMKDWQTDIFAAALETEYSSGNIRELINLAENSDLFDLQPAFSEEQYGEFQIQMEKDNSAEIFERLEKSDDPAEHNFANYVLKLEEFVNIKAYGRHEAVEEGGSFTERGYLALRGEMKDVYCGPEDIPLEHRIFSAPEPLLMAVDVDMPAFLAQLHAVAGDFSRAAEHNIGVLARLRSTDYLLLMGDDGAHITETAHAYRHGTDAFDHWMHAAEAPGTQAFTIHLTEVHGQITGNIAQVDARARWLDISENSIHPVKVEATIKVGETLEYTPEEWDALDPIEKDGMQNWRRVFEDDAFSEVFHHVAEAARKDEDTCQPVSGQAFLAAVNAAYMEQARCPQPKLMRVSQAAAQEMLARGDSDVYRLLPEGPEKLSPTDAIKSGLWFSEHREFAIRREDMAGLEKWAERSVVAIMSRPQERDEPKKAHEQEV